LTIAGAHIVVGENARNSSAAVVSGAPYFWHGTNGIEGFVAEGACSLLSPQTDGQPPSTGVAGAISLVDAFIESSSCRPSECTAVASSRSVYMRRVRVDGLRYVARTYSPRNHMGGGDWNPVNVTAVDTLATQGPTRRLSVSELSFAVPCSAATKNTCNYNATQWVDGKMSPAIINVSAAAQLWELSPDATCDQHGWGDNSMFPTHARQGAVNVKAVPYAAIGNGVHDDTAALQHAVDDAAADRTGQAFVFLPRGAYRTSRPVRVPRGVRIIGLARHLTTVVATDNTFGNEEVARLPKNTAELEPEYSAQPIFSFTDQPAPSMIARALPSAATTPESVLFGLTMVVPLFNNHTNTSMIVFRAGVSRSGAFNVARQFWATRVPMCGQWWSLACRARFFNHPPYRHAYVRVEGEAATVRMFVLFQEDGARNGGDVSQSP